MLYASNFNSLFMIECFVMAIWVFSLVFFLLTFSNWNTVKNRCLKLKAKKKKSRISFTNWLYSVVPVIKFITLHIFILCRHLIPIYHFNLKIHQKQQLDEQILNFSFVIKWETIKQSQFLIYLSKGTIKDCDAF